MTYNEFIQGIIDSRGQWAEEVRESYCERHHIVPRCMGGEPKKLTWKHHENVIWLTASEHFIAHKLLAYENPDNSAIVGAWCCMAFPKGKTKRQYAFTPEEYEEVRVAWSKVCSFKQLGREPWNKGKSGIYSEESLKKMSESCKGKTHTVSEQARKKISEATKRRDKSTFGYATRGKKCVTNGEINIYIPKDAVPPDGFRVGLTKENQDTSNYVSAWTEERRKAQSKRSSGQNNNMFGKGYKLAGGNNGKATKRYYYKDLVFECRKELVQYLKENVDDRVGVSTIRAFENGSSRVIKKFQEVLKHLKWVYKDEDKKD